MCKLRNEFDKWVFYGTMKTKTHWDLRPKKEPDKLKIYADQFNFCVNVWLRFNIKEEKNNGLQKWTGLTRDAIDDNKF